MMYVMLLVGFLLLIKGADFFVEGSSSIAKLLRVPTVVIGLTVVAMGTSAPEMAVSITAGLKGSNALAISNVLGSNLFNLLVVVGACGVVIPMVIHKDIETRDFPFSILMTAVLLVMMVFDRTVGRLDGIILLVIMACYLIYIVRDALKKREPEVEDALLRIRLSPAVSTAYIIGGAVAIVIGGDMVVNNASEIAAVFGLSQTLIGLTIVAMGTSLPELVTSIVAARKGENAMAMGNVIGSNIFNIMAVLAISAAIHPIHVELTAIYDTMILLGCSLLIWVVSYKKQGLGRIACGGMLLIYAAYTVYIILR